VGECVLQGRVRRLACASGGVRCGVCMCCQCVGWLTKRKKGEPASFERGGEGGWTVRIRGGGTPVSAIWAGGRLWVSDSMST
jgi:hypothetical protein